MTSLFTQSIYAPSSPDSLRISVMSRHTLPNGIVPDPLITLDSYHLWLQDLAPPDRLVGAWYRRELLQEQFTAAYLAHLRQDPQKRTLDLLIELVLRTSRKPTLLCVEPTNQFCHRRPLAEYCRQLEPRLQVVHL
ncbi:MAG TPA: DUF488 domain-containing protein [Candidatus Nanoarchaeia archaeon]|nr:DUF488 domain-containing protein [Candidatus Nanoarchaeia archaeon]